MNFKRRMAVKIEKIFFITLCFLALSGPLGASGRIRIVTTTSTFERITKAIVGDKAEVYSIASPNRDIHFISPTPKDIVKMKSADVFVHAGLDLEIWRASLLDAVGRTDLMWPSGDRQIDVSRGIELLEVPSNLSRAQGDVHAYGNPHYWMDPANAKAIARNIAEGLAGLYPADAAFFMKNSGDFANRIDRKMKEWETLIAPFRGAGIVVYHNDWPYFMGRFGFVVCGYLEPKPGIPPTARHIQEIERIMAEKGVRVIVKEVFHESRTPNKIAEETGARVVTLSQEAGEVKGDYFALIDHDVQELVKALKQ